MKLLEYEAKRLLKASGIPVPQSLLIHSPDKPGITLPVVLKSQVPTGGRGKAGGIRVVERENDITSEIEDLFALSIKGFLPNFLLAEERLDIAQEFYLSTFIDKVSAEIKLMAHKNGGVEVEENDPNSFFTLPFDITQAEVIGENLAEYFNIPEQSFALQDLVENLARCFVKNDALLLEINPLVVTRDGKLVAGDCKIELDDAARFRHSDWDFEDTPEDTNFVVLDQNGTVATIANGAGLAMATVDAVAAGGMRPANFLDIGGGANTESILRAFTKIMEFPKIEAIVINIFAGITRCDEVARAIIEAKKEIPALPPLYIRLAGTNFEKAVEILAAEEIPTLATLDECLKAAKEIHYA